MLGKLKQEEHTFEAWLCFRVSSKQCRTLRETASKKSKLQRVGYTAAEYSTGIDEALGLIFTITELKRRKHDRDRQQMEARNRISRNCFQGSWDFPTWEL